MKRTTVPRSEIAATIGDALRKLVEDPTSHDAMADLGRVLCVNEAIGVSKLIIEERVRCGRCRATVPHSRSDGPLCMGCATAAKYERERTNHGF